MPPGFALFQPSLPENAASSAKRQLLLMREEIATHRSSLCVPDCPHPRGFVLSNLLQSESITNTLPRFPGGFVAQAQFMK